MANKIFVIKKKSVFLKISKNNRTYTSKNIILRKMFDNNVKETFRVGYVATKKLGNAVKRNRAKRIMRELIRKNISKHGQYNYFYVLIAKKTIFDTSLQNLENEFVKLLLKK